MEKEEVIQYNIKTMKRTIGDRVNEIYWNLEQNNPSIAEALLENTKEFALEYGVNKGDKEFSLMEKINNIEIPEDKNFYRLLLNLDLQSLENHKAEYFESFLNEILRAEKNDKYYSMVEGLKIISSFAYGLINLDRNTKQKTEEIFDNALSKILEPLSPITLIEYPNTEYPDLDNPLDKVSKCFENFNNLRLILRFAPYGFNKTIGTKFSSTESNNILKMLIFKLDLAEYFLEKNKLDSAKKNFDLVEEVIKYYQQEEKEPTIMLKRELIDNGMNVINKQQSQLLTPALLQKEMQEGNMNVAIELHMLTTKLFNENYNLNPESPRYNERREMKEKLERLREVFKTTKN